MALSQTKAAKEARARRAAAKAAGGDTPKRPRKANKRLAAVALADAYLAGYARGSQFNAPVTLGEVTNYAAAALAK